ncbi:MAG: putative zinc-binding protein [Ignavibacteriales bacterium]
MSKKCCSDPTNRMVVACSGASNLGQISNATAVKIHQQGVGQMTCLAALGANVDSYLKAAKESDLVVLDGCPVSCAKTTVEQIGLSDFTYFEISGLLPHVVKSKEYDQVESESQKLISLILEQLA